MLFIQTTALLAALLSSALAKPITSNADPATTLFKRDSFSCDGSALCKSQANLRRDCDLAANQQLELGYLYKGSSLGAEKPIKDGECYKAPFDTLGSCKIWFEGPEDCQGTGQDMWNGYQEIHNADCNTCGYKSFTGNAGSACKLKVDYIYELNDACPEEIWGGYWD